MPPTLVMLAVAAGKQVYAASVMFGYFLRRVNERFQLEKALGTLPVTKEDAVARLERLFSIVSGGTGGRGGGWTDDCAPTPPFA